MTEKDEALLAAAAEMENESVLHTFALSFRLIGWAATIREALAPSPPAVDGEYRAGYARGFEEGRGVGCREADERVAQLIAHRACHSSEHDPAHGKLHGFCIVCGIPWPCDYAGKPHVATQPPASDVASRALERLEKDVSLMDGYKDVAKVCAAIRRLAPTAKENDNVADRNDLVRHAIKLIQRMQPWDGKTFDSELSHMLSLLAQLPTAKENQS